MRGNRDGLVKMLGDESMAVYSSLNSSTKRQATVCRESLEACRERDNAQNRYVTIGLVNNMSDGALEATERQFVRLLEIACDGIEVCLSLYTLPGICRGQLADRHIKRHYSSVESLDYAKLDGLIVTGREPSTSNLEDEPYWKSFIHLVEWARENTCSTIWSCLAAHAAVLHTDGIHRLRSAQKCSGVFECTRASDHALMVDTPSHFRLPHSRWNGVPENVLAGCGYRVLTRAVLAGVDTFVKQYESLFIFFQGHPEYEPDTLLIEYRRDVARYLRGDAPSYPRLPQNYFDAVTTATLMQLQSDVMRHTPQQQAMERLSASLAQSTLEQTWTSTATSIYRNWLHYIYSRKLFQMNGRSGNVTNVGVDDPSLAVTVAGGSSA